MKYTDVQDKLPEWLQELTEEIHEHVPKFKKMVKNAYKEGLDFDSIKASFLIYVLESTLDNFDHNKYPDVFNCITRVIELYRTNEQDKGKWEEAGRAASTAERAAGKAGGAARYAAWYAARVAWWAACATSNAAEAAWYAAEAAWYAARVAWWAARVAAWDPAADATFVAVDAAQDAAEADAYRSFGDKLIELMINKGELICQAR